MMKRHLSQRTRVLVPLAAAVPHQARAQSATPIGSPAASHVAGDTPFAAIAEDMLASVNAHLSSRDDTGLYVPGTPSQPDDRPYAYLWPFSALVSGLSARARYRQDERATQDFMTILDTLERYFDADANPKGYDSYPTFGGGGDKFYDDNQWLGMDFLHAFHLTGDDHWLEKARLIWEFSQSGWDEIDHGGGIYWKQDDISTKNTCSNGPAAVLGMMLYEMTGDQTFLDWSVRIMNWLDILFDESLGVYNDNIDLTGRINRDKWTYNTGTPMEASARLYGATGDPAWLEKARTLAASSLSFFASVKDANGVRSFPNTPWFNAVLHRGYCALYDVDPDEDRTYIDALPESLLRAWQTKRDANGFLSADWNVTGPGPERVDLLDQVAVIEIASLAALQAGA